MVVLNSDYPKNKALILGITGQDGAYLARNLLNKGYEVVGTSRQFTDKKMTRLDSMGIKKQIELLNVLPEDLEQIHNLVAEIKPTEIFNLAGQSSVGLSFTNPVETFNGIVLGNINILETIKKLDLDIKYCLAGSGECFGNLGNFGATELTPFRPLSPYAVAKSSASMTVKLYRECYGLFASTAILYNHESFFRANSFVTKKIVTTACKIKTGGAKMLELGNINVSRDWGWAPEYMKAMCDILQNERSDDFIVATGRPITLSDFIYAVFDELGISWKKYLIVNDKNKRPLDVPISFGNPKKIYEKLGWRAVYSGKDVARKMVREELKNIG